MELKFKKLNEKAVLPSRSHVTDAGLDLTTYGFTQEVDASGKLILVYHTGLAVEIPEGHMGLLFMRSSVATKSVTMTNCVGIVDSGYRGELIGKFKITTGAGNHLTPRTSDYESTTPKTGGAHPISWQVGKVWTPGAGYRDNHGNYYDYKGIPIVTPVDTKGR
jgi:hypothetical protein